MKKGLYLIFTITLFFSLCKGYSAAVTSNGITINANSDSSDKSISLTCKYSSGKEFYLGREDQYDTDLEENHETGENYGINDGYIIKNDTFLKGNDFLSERGYFDCPLYVTYNENENKDIIYNGFTNTAPKDHFFTLIKEQSKCVGACLGEQYQSENENKNSWICNYSGPSGNIITENRDGVYLIFYSDGNSEEVDVGDLSENCGDIVYNPHIGGDKPFYNINYNILVDQNTTRLEEMYDFLCVGDSFVGEYFCETGKECRFPENKNITCQKIQDRLNKISTPPSLNFSDFCTNTGVKNAMRFIGYLLLIVKILVPIILIIMGFLDFSKAVVASKEDNLQKAIKTFALRCLTGAIIFILPTIINFVFGIIVKTNVGYQECRVCIFSPGKCENG